MANINIPDSALFQAGAGPDLKLTHDGSNSTISNATGTLTINNIASASLILGTANTTALTIDSSQRVGIGETSPLGNLHVKSGDSGVSSPDITELVVEGSGNTGISILTPNNQQGEIAFGDPQDANVGRIAYNHDSNFLATVVNGSEVMRITSGGNVGINETSPYDSNWGSSSKQLTITGSDYAVLRLKDHDSNFAIGAGDGRHYISYDRTAERHNLIADADGVLRSSKGVEFEGTALGAGQTGIASSGDGGDLRLYKNGTQALTLTSRGTRLTAGQTFGSHETDSVTINGSSGAYTTAMTFSESGAGRGMYLVTAVHDGASVGTHGVYIIGVSSTSNIYLYATIVQNSLSINISGASLQLRHEASTSTANVTVNAIPLSLTGN